MNTKKLIIISPNDRYNYGDLLFSHIVKNQLQDLYSVIVNVATTSNDLTSVGGDKVSGIEILYQRKFTDTDLILAGGESLMTDWFTCCSFIKENTRLPLIIQIIILIADRFSPKYSLILRNWYGRQVFKGKTRFPYSIAKGEVPGIRRIIYSSLGAASLTSEILTKKKIADLSNIDYISVRDRKAFDTLRGFKINVKLVPDTAILMSEYYPKIILKKKVSVDVLSFVQEKCYIFFQINWSEGQKNIERIASDLAAINAETGAHICLCTIGYAPGHDDSIALKKLYDALGEEISTLFDNHTIWDIMYLIANSCFYAGTSLHGVITAMSFSVPYIGLYRWKTQAYIETWGVDIFHTKSKTNNLLSLIEMMQVDYSDVLHKNREQQITLVQDSFTNIRNMLYEE